MNVYPEHIDNVTKQYFFPRKYTQLGNDIDRSMCK